MKNQHWNNRVSIEKIIRQLVKVPSISGTSGEEQMGETIQDLLSEIPYFQAHPECIRQKLIEGDPLRRKSVAAFYKGNPSSTKTIFLLSHYDVVGVNDFGNLKPIAFQVNEYTAKLKEDGLAGEAKDDIETGEWMFARGIMDMKAGLAIQLAVLSEACATNMEVNLLLLSTPDEERNSEGMFAGVKLLLQLQEEYSLDYEICICSEPSFASYPGDDSKYIYLGSVGKLLPLIYCAGLETHVGEPLDGVNAAWMAAEIVKSLELSELFIDEYEKEKNPPPTCLKMTDLKEQYDVQTPSNAYILYNILTLTQSPADVMEKLVGIAEGSSRQIHSKMKNTYKRLEAKLPKSTKPVAPKVFTFSQLYDIGVERYGEKFVTVIGEFREIEPTTKVDLREISARLATALCNYFNDLRPFYLIMFAPPYYPHINLDRKNEQERRFHRLASDIVDYANTEFSENIAVKTFFPGLSDVSYCRLQDADKVISTLEKEMPLYGYQYRLPLDEIRKLNVPSINIGPYGKDAHKRTERLHMPFSTIVAPQLLKRTIEMVANLK